MSRFRFFSVVFLVGISKVVSAQNEVDLQELQVSATRSSVEFSEASRTVRIITKKEIEEAPVNTINELLEYATNVDVRQRGAQGVQADISIRGSGFEQVLILLNGVKMTDPQTGHHNMNIPVELMDIERIEVLNGGASRIFGPGAFAGAINIITKNPAESGVRISAEAGDFGYSQLGARANIAADKHNHSLSILQRQGDGYIRNTDFDLLNIFWQSEFHTEKSDWFLNLGQNEKSFGALNFYSARFPDQFESTKSQFVSLGGEMRFDQLTISPKAYYRRHNDRFELFRESEGFYRRIPDDGGFTSNQGDTIPWYTGHNYHQTDVYGAEVNGAYKWKFGTSSVGYEFRSEEVLSNVLGEPLDNPLEVPGEFPGAFYRNGADRQNHSIYIEHTYSKGDFFISAGVMYNHNTDFGDEFFPGADVSYQVTDHIRPYASVNRSFRLPSYTDLYYNLGGAVGSIDLEPESSINYELGAKFDYAVGRGDVAVFTRDGSNLIDWIRFSGSDMTTAANITEVRISGVEANFTWDMLNVLGGKSPLKSIQTGYSYMFSDSLSNDFESLYVLDFLEQKADLGFYFQFGKNFHVNWFFSYQDRLGSFVDADGMESNYQPVVLSDLRVSPQFGKLKLFVQVSNLFDETYNDIGSVIQPGRWFRLGMNYEFSIMKR
ncbi:TonB-dependent receptor [Cryomorphaceae bacterium 1068]|nr:TonB-dependent receptor [Cryomorphaceae bacterium 1068]